MNLVFFTLSLSLFDSLSTAQQIIVFILLLTTKKPLENALWYLAGLAGSYFVCGILGYMAFDSLRSFLGQFIPSMDRIPDPVYYQSEMFTGFILTLIGFWYFRKNRHARPKMVHNIILAKLYSMNSLFAFAIGVFISVTSFPLALPYLA
ncbi:MAG: GAP family protein, partial [Oligoflexales bacterium]|nr:GAP family protein [Oligoflexales bacterium]